MSETPFAQQTIPRQRWMDIEDALLMEVYPRSRIAGGNLGWAEIATLMNENVATRGIEVRRIFRENTVRSHWNDHQTQLLARYGTGGQVAAITTGAPNTTSNIMGSVSSGPPSRQQSIEPAAVSFYTPPINHHRVVPPSWVPDPVLPGGKFEHVFCEVTIANFNRKVHILVGIRSTDQEFPPVQQAPPSPATEGKASIPSTHRHHRHLGKTREALLVMNKKEVQKELEKVK